MAKQLERSKNSKHRRSSRTAVQQARARDSFFKWTETNAGIVMRKRE